MIWLGVSVMLVVDVVYFDFFGCCSFGGVNFGVVVVVLLLDGLDGVCQGFIFCVVM